MQDITVARLSTRVRTSLSPSFKCNVLRESLSVDSQNIPCATLKRRGVWVISVYLWLKAIMYFNAFFCVLLVRTDLTHRHPVRLVPQSGRHVLLTDILQESRHNLEDESYSPTSCERRATIWKTSLTHRHPARVAPQSGRRVLLTDILQESRYNLEDESFSPTSCRRRDTIWKKCLTHRHPVRGAPQSFR
jgi:hypothetical protein